MRRAFLAVALLASSCGAPRAPSPPPAALPPAVHDDLEVRPALGEVWATDVEIEVTAETELASCVRAVTRSAWSETERDAGERRGRGLRLRVPLAFGENVVSLTCRDARGDTHRGPRARFVRRLPERPEVRLAAEEGGGGLVLAARGVRPGERSSWSGVTHGEGERATVAGDGVARVRVVDGAGRAEEAAVRIARDAAGLHVVDGAAPRTDAPPGVVYGVHPTLYGTPGLPAVTARLADLRDLGVDVVWITPPYASPPGDFGYAVTDPFRLREEMGTEDDLRALVEEAHRVGLRVVLDFVPNHTSDHHPWFALAEGHGPRASSWRFHARDEAGHPTHYFDWTNLPNLDFGVPDVRRAAVEAARHWQARAGVDGFRVDAAWGPGARAPDFVREWVRAVRARDPDALLFAEASARDPAWLATGFDAAYDWTDELGRWAWQDVWTGDAAGIPDRLAQSLAASRAKAPGAAQTRVLRFLDNNDTGARFVTRHGPALTRAATAALLTLPGAPMLFAGSEVGAEYEPYGGDTEGVLAEARDVHGLRPYVKELLALRSAHPALRGDELARVEARDATTGAIAKDVLAYTRRDAASGERLLVVIHFARERAVRVDVDGRATCLTRGCTARPERRGVVITGATPAAVVTLTAKR